MTVKPRAIVIRLHLTPDEKNLLTRHFRKSGNCGLREGLRRAAVDTIIEARDAERDSSCFTRGEINSQITRT